MPKKSKLKNTKNKSIKKKVPPREDMKPTPQDKKEYFGCAMPPNPNKKPGKASKIKIDCSNSH